MLVSNNGVVVVAQRGRPLTPKRFKVIKKYYHWMNCTCSDCVFKRHLIATVELLARELRNSYCDPEYRMSQTSRARVWIDCPHEQIFDE
jgi:hypothetical protein